MNWLTASSLMFVSSVISYLFVRLAGQQKINNSLKNLAMFLIPVILYSFMAINQQTNFAVTQYQFLIIVIMAVFCSYLGNKLSLKSIELAPNPGFSLVISKSYVVFTSIAAIFLFNSPLTIKATIAVLLIVFGSALIMIDKTKQAKTTAKTWFWLALGAFFCWGLLALTSKYLLDLGVSILVRLIYSMLIVSTIILAEIWQKKISLKLNRPQLQTLLVIGLFGAGFNYFMQLAYQLTPNVGYVNAINASSIALVTLLSGFIFKDELNLKKLIGVGVVSAGIILLVLTK